MKNFIVLEGDMVLFEPQFGHRIVTPLAPAMMRAKGQAKINGRRVCVVGDEKQLQVPAQYLVPGYAPGMGTLTIMTLLPNQQAPLCRSGASLLLKGQQFLARFTPSTPATLLSPPNTPDPPAPSIGKGRFITTQFLASVG